MNELSATALRQRNWLALRKALGIYFTIGTAIALLVPENVAGNLWGVRQLLAGQKLRESSVLSVDRADRKRC